MRKWEPVVYATEIEVTANYHFTARLSKEEDSFTIWFLSMFDNYDRTVDGPCRFSAQTTGDAILFASEQLTRWGYTL